MIDETPTGRMIEVFLAGGAEYFARMSGERTKRVLTEKAKSGWYPGGGTNIPIGYKRVKINRSAKVDTSYIFVPTIKSRHIAEAYKMYDEGKSIGQIVKYLEESKVRTRNGNKIVSKTVNQILSNPFYAGNFTWGHKVYEGKHKSVVDKELWERVQKRIKSKPYKKYREGKYFYLLRGLACCSVCGHQLWGETHNRKSGRVYAYYACRYCKRNWWVACDKCEGDIRDRIRHLAFDKKTIEEIKTRATTLLGERNEADSERFKNLNEERVRLESALTKLEDSMFLDGSSDSRLKETWDRYNSMLEFVKSSIQIMNGDSIKTLDLLDKLIALAMNLGIVYDSLNLENKQKLLRLLIHKIQISPQGIVDVEYQLPLVDFNPVRDIGKRSPPYQQLEQKQQKIAIKVINFTIKHSNTIQSLANFV
jgi:site-specific DNA recombinase